MDLNERLKQFEKELAARAADAERRARDTLAQAERRLQKTLSGARGETKPDTASPIRRPDISAGVPLNLRIDMTGSRLLAVLDEEMDAAFEIRRHLGRSMSAYKTTYCETPREYVEPMLAQCPMSAAQREAYLSSLEQAVQQGHVPAILTSLGVHIPGLGCLINGWLFGREMNLTPAEVPTVPEGLARVVTTAAHEKLGHGFITELTAAGAEKKSVNLGMYHLVEQFDMKTVDTPDHARLSEQWEILFQSSQYVEEGFATWIARHLMERFVEQGRADETLLSAADSFKLTEVLPALCRMPGGDDCARAVEALFAPSAPQPNVIHDAMRAVRDKVAGMKDPFAQIGPYVVGYCMCDQIAQRHGAKCVPYAVAMACNLHYGLATISNQDLRNFVETRPDLNVNTRLALMMFVSEGPRDDVEGFLQRVYEECALTPPARL